MIESYPAIKLVHVGAVILSGCLFALRGVLVLAGNDWANKSGVRHLSYAIDTTLLGAALLLVAMLHQYPFAQAWLTVKVLLLVIYIVLGVFALRRARTRAGRLACLTAALAVYLFIVSVARSHNPYGAFSVLMP